ncbi:MAG: hypothetical protein ACOX7H_00170 [Bacillota bacterium]
MYYRLLCSSQRTICIYVMVNVHSAETIENTKPQTVVMAHYCDCVGIAAKGMFIV